MEHQATVDKGLKMKIKRKNLVSKTESGSSPSKHEIIKDDGGKASSTMTSLSSSHMPGASVASGSNATANNTSSSGSGALSMGAPSTLDKLKQTLADKERDRLNSAGKGVGGVPHGSLSTTNTTTGSNSTSQNCSRNMNKRERKSKSTSSSGSSSETMNVGNQNGSFVASGSMSNAITNNSHTAGTSSSVASGTLATSAGSASVQDASNSVMVELHRMSGPPSVKKEPTPADPYEFNGKEDDPIGLPVKKVKLEKADMPTSPAAAAAHTDMEVEQRDMSTETCSVGVATDPDCLGPCEPGTSVVLEGIVWNETENGILVVNITWRGKTYVGTLMDATKHAWAPPRFSCESPANGPEVRTPRGRGKRGRAAVTPPVIDLGERRLRKRRNNNNNPYAAPPSPARSETTKRRGRPADLDLDLDGLRSSKRPRTAKSATSTVTTTPENGFIECPEPNCSKKYRHINGLRYHQAHAHKNDYVDEESCLDDNKTTEDNTAEETKFKPVTTSPGTKGPGRGRKSTPSTSSQCDNTQTDNAEDGMVEPKTELASPGPKTGKKSRKEAQESKKQLEKQPTVALTPVSLEDMVSGTSTSLSQSMYHQTSSTTGTLSCGVTTVSVVPSTAGVQSAATTTVSTVPVAVTTVTSSGEGKSKKSKGEKGEKKGKKSHSNASGSSTPAQISIAASHPQNANGLKPIQPKPTVLGEPNTGNQALVGLKEKKQKKKKNKDKDKEKKEKDKSSSKDSVKQDLVQSVEHIRPSESQQPQTVGVNKSLEALVKMSTPPELQKQATLQLGGGSSTLDKPSGSPPELQKQAPLSKVNSPMKSAEGTSTRPPSSLSINSPVHPPNQDGKDTGANAQSPAYSDISDANDSNSNLDQESNLQSGRQNKVKEEPSSNKQQAAQAQQQSQQQAQQQQQQQQQQPQPQQQQMPSGSVETQPPNSQGYHSNVYGSYFQQGQYHCQNNAPHGASGHDQQQMQQKPHNVPVHGGNKPSASTPSKEMNPEKKPREDITPKVEPKSSAVMEDVKAKEGRSEKDMGGSKQSPTPAQMREYQERMIQAQQMAQYHQYMGAYGYGVDMRLLATNPEYKAQYEKWFMEQGRARREYMEQQQKLAMNGAKGDPSGKDPNQQPLDLNTKAMDLSKQGKSSPASKPSASATMKMVDLRNSPVSSKHGEGSKGKEGQSGMLHPEQQRMMGGKDGKRPGPEGHGFDDGKSDGRGGYPGYSERNEDYRRSYYMYQQQQHQHQRMLEHKRLMEQQKQQGHHSGKAEESDKKGVDIRREPNKSQSMVKEGRQPDMHGSYKSPQQPPQNNDPRNSASMDHAQKLDSKDKMKSSNPVSSSPSGTKPQKDAYGQYYPQGGYPGYKVPYDPSHPIYQQGSGTVGYAQNSYPPYPPHMRGSFPEGIFKENSGKATSPSPSVKSSPSTSTALPAQEGKALELLQQKAAYYRSHSPQKGAPEKGEKPGKDTERAPNSSEAKPEGSGKDKDKDRKSPPTQRHVHTHHHTHVVGPAYSLYGPYGAMMASQQAAASAASMSMGSPPK